MARDFYIVLGISTDADPQQIKSAYRRLVKVYHPDITQHQEERFLEVQDAFDTLSDPELREKYDSVRKLTESSENRRAPNEHIYTVSKSHTTRAEPLVPDRTSDRQIHRRHPFFSMGDEMDRRFTDLDEFFHGWVPDMLSSSRGASRRKDLFVEIVLSPGEAAVGGLIPLKVPIERICGRCNGTGVEAFLYCRMCRGEGKVTDYHQIEVSVPPGVADGKQVRLSLADIGLSGSDLIVLVTISAESL